MFTHVQSHFCQISLGTQVHIEVRFHSYLKIVFSWNQRLMVMRKNSLIGHWRLHISCWSNLDSWWWHTRWFSQGHCRCWQFRCWCSGVHVQGFLILRNCWYRLGWNDVQNLLFRIQCQFKWKTTKCLGILFGKLLDNIANS